MKTIKLKEAELKAIANLKFYSSDLEKEVNIKSYLAKQLCMLWRYNEEFNCYEHEIYAVLVKHNYIKKELEYKEGQECIMQLIGYIFTGA